MPFVLLWMLSPVLAWRISVPPKIAKSQVLSSAETRSLRLIARRTWRFFEAFVDQEVHALPLDTFQEEPGPAGAHRTSPTNLGLYLLGTTVAHDFGWIGILDTVERLETTLRTMSELRRGRGAAPTWSEASSRVVPRCPGSRSSRSRGRPSCRADRAPGWSARYGELRRARALPGRCPMEAREPPDPRTPRRSARFGGR